MVTDRELLELAAKAAGIEIVKWGLVSAEIRRPQGGFDPIRYWNPLHDDGDALRLAVKLGLCVECKSDGHAYVWLGDDLLWNEFALHEDVESERLAATRRAIVRAAAEIGKSKD